MAKPVLLPNLDAPEAGVISTHELRRFLAGELSPDRRATLEERIGAEPALAARFAALADEIRAEEAAFQLEVPLPRFLMEQEERAARRGGLWARLLALRFTVGAGALVATAAAIFLVVRAPGAEDPEVPWDGLKGGARVGFFVKDEEGARFGRAGEELAAGDRIQFAVRDDDVMRAMVLVGIDGKGAVTVYAAEDVAEARTKGATGSRPPAAAPRLLPVSVVLDDATGPERFFVVYADGDVDEVQRQVERAARDLAGRRPNLLESDRLSLPASFAQSSVHIVKVAPGAAPPAASKEPRAP
jgi:hypothetical protein